MKKILIAGIGNIFFGDDAFGGEVVRRLKSEALPEQVKLVDFGIRTRDLAFELCENYETVVIVDAVQIGEKKGTVSLVELDPADFSAAKRIDPHAARLAEALSLARNLGAGLKQIYLVGYETDAFEFNRKPSPQCRKMLPEAVRLVKKLVEENL
ncbi:MAG: hydrogenase maturation protease [Acidobacteria bacterium]|nr:hydrogenase maturation protease [Acidobacteriota bacterium]